MGRAGAGLSPKAQGWGAEGFIYTPPVFQPVLNSAAGQAKLFLPGSDALSLSLEGELPIVSPVVGLDVARSPSHVARRIVSVNVNPVQGMFRGRATTNLKDKLLHRVKAKLDSPTSVVVVFSHAWIVTATLGIVKSPKLRASLFSVGPELVADHFSMKATTGAGVAVAQLLPIDSLLRPAVAKHCPPGPPWCLARHPVQDHQSPEPLASEVYHLCHQLISSELVTGQELALAVPQLS
jgi:hypothetical protein